MNPTRVVITDSAPYGLLRIRNEGAETMRVQASAFRWRMSESIESLDATDAVLINPPIFKLEPGETQLLRIGLRSPVPSQAGVELAYRVILEEIPPSRASDVGGIRTLLRISLPLFARAERTRPHALEWSLKQAEDGLRLRVRNLGGQHALLSRLLLRGWSKQPLAVSLSAREYVLPGAYRDWLIDAPAAAPDAQLSVLGRLDGGSFRAELPALQQ